MTEAEKHIPGCVGVIMDGNRRWAKNEGLAPSEGHRVGYEKMKEAVDWAEEYGIKHLVVYAFSTENWKRSEEEVNAILSLMRIILVKDIEILKEKNIRIKFRGQMSRLPQDLRKSMAQAEKDTEENTRMTFVILVSYGGRAEIVEAVKGAREETEITEDVLKNHMWLSDVPDPDIVMRTGGERRLSNFLLWHIAYSELYFTDVFWPAFTKKDFMDAMSEYASRKRRYGK